MPKVKSTRFGKVPAGFPAHLVSKANLLFIVNFPHQRGCKSISGFNPYLYPMPGTTDLSKFNNDWYNPGASLFKRAIWYVVNAAFFCSRFPINGVKIFLLRLFGAKVGKGVVIKPGVNVKSPWFLVIGDYCWIGEKVWIDNLVLVKIGSNSCISQGAMLLTGNHNYKRPAFDLITGEITLEEGVWIGAKATVCPGVICHSHSLLMVGSVAASSLEAYGIYRGNPAVKVREREIKAASGRSDRSES